MSLDKLIEYHSALPRWAQDAGAQWRQRLVWPWHDAVIWVASQNPDYMEIVCASRAYAEGHYEDRTTAAQAALWAYDEALRDLPALDAARSLCLALQRGEVAGEGRPTLDDVAIPIPATVWADSHFKSEDGLRAFAAIGPRDGASVWFWRVALGRDTILSAFPQQTVKMVVPAPKKLFDRFASWRDQMAWYVQRIENAPAPGYSRKEDEAAAEAVGISRSTLRALRNEAAPDHWKEPGRKMGPR